ncbi:MAG: secondary thiamine-phosphate synthase enzyme YjbQ [Coraliomargaritaceae bacterium]|jgi:secondary thiamine-phosphate synthase enzyme
MKCINRTIAIESKAYQLKEITQEVKTILISSEINEGLATVFCQHTSCSLVIMENADPSASRDLENFICRLVPENDPNFTHIYEGVDDMPSHIKMALTRTSESIPIVNGRLALGTWQGVFLWEHRAISHRRNIVISLQGI